MTRPTAATGHGLRTTRRPHLPHQPLSGSETVTKRFGITRRLLMRCPSNESSAGRRVIETITETAGMSMPPIPIDLMNGNGRSTMLRQPDGDRRTRDDHRPARMRHRLDQSGLDVLAGGQLLAEAEDHQQRVIDRDAETDECNQELDDDRDVREVGQQPHDRERVEDRRDRNRERNRDRRDRPEHEEKDHERSEAADQRLRQDTRPAAAAARGVVERQQARERSLDPRRTFAFSAARTASMCGLARERVLSRRIDLGEGRVPIARDVEEVVRIEVRADTASPG